MEIQWVMEPILPDYEWIEEFSMRKRKTELDGKLCGVRLDINSPVENGKVVDNPRITEAARLITKYIKEYKMIPVIFCHQGRKNAPDLTSTAKHAELLNAKTPSHIQVLHRSRCLRVKKEFLNSLDVGQAVVLENSRMLDPAFGDWEKNPEEGRKLLASTFDGILSYYILDAFPTAHRSDTTMTPAFQKTQILIGEHFEREHLPINDLRGKVWYGKVMNFGFGGAKLGKVSDIVKLLQNENVYIYLGGVPAQIMLHVLGYPLGKTNETFVLAQGNLEDAKRLATAFGDRISLPFDFNVEFPDHSRRMLNLTKLPSNPSATIIDIGRYTVDSIIEDVNYEFVLAGPLGVVEKGGASTINLISGIHNRGVSVTILGGDSTHLTNKYGLGGIPNFKYLVSGGAALHYIAGNRMKCLEFLRKEYWEAEP
jgi:phosphoglycerate kinase